MKQKNIILVLIKGTLLYNQPTKPITLGAASVSNPTKDTCLA